MECKEGAGGKPGVPEEEKGLPGGTEPPFPFFWSPGFPLGPQEALQSFKALTGCLKTLMKGMCSKLHLHT